jgi:CubicO group peptidase (beta-lactamase class C family)
MVSRSKALTMIGVMALVGCRDGGRADHGATVTDVVRAGSPSEVAFEDLDATVRTSLHSERGTTTLAARMAELSVPGVAVSVVRDGRMWGSFAAGATPDGRAMTPRTLTQVGSVSKPVAAVAAIRMVVDGQLPWDDDITPLLVSYDLPPGRQSAAHPVTVAALLSHTAGATVPGFLGYERASDAPALPELLAGKGNSPAVEVVSEPGSSFNYSGGGYELLEQTMLDVSGAADFDTLLRELVFAPAGMVDSRYALELPADVAAHATPGSSEGTMLTQRWQAHPESAAAGLWTTADDLGRFLAALSASLSGVDETLLPSEWAHRMVSGVKTADGGAQMGHGLFVNVEATEYWHGGVNIGYNAFVAGTVDGRFAIAVVTNSDSGGIAVATEIIDTIAATVGWR